MKPNKKQVFSFKAISLASSQSSLGESRQQIKQLPTMYFQNEQLPNKIKSGIFRYQKQFQRQFQKSKDTNFKKQKSFINFGQTKIHPKVKDLDKQIQQNLRRRLQLQQQLNLLKKHQQSTYAQQVFNRTNNNTYKNNIQAERQFSLRSKQTQLVDQKLNKYNTNQQINQSVKVLTGNNLKDIISKTYTNQSKKGYTLDQFIKFSQKQQENQKKHKQHKKLAVQLCSQPNLIKVQSLLNMVTFPEVPKQNLQTLYKRCYQLYSIHKPHSDIIYLMMAISFHLQKYNDVRKYFKEIILFKKFDKKAYWVSAQTEYTLQNYDRCIKLNEICMSQLDDKFLPRFLYLQSKCYNQIGNFTNSIVCYNQLIRIKPKISQYYLQRAILYEKLGYQKESKDDYLMFGILKPNAKQYLQQRIIVEDNQAKRKQLLSIYKKII